MRKKLYRSRSDRVIAGVCGGIADYFEVDPTLIRLGFVLIVFLEGLGLLGYILAWIIVPERPVTPEGEEVDYEVSDYQREEGESSEDTDNRRKFFGGVLIFLGLFFLADYWIPLFYLKRFWPLILIAGGGLIIMREVRSHG